MSRPKPKQLSCILTMTLHPEANPTKSELREYVVSAVRGYSGGMDPEDELFNAIATAKVSRLFEGKVKPAQPEDDTPVIPVPVNLLHEWRRGLLALESCEGPLRHHAKEMLAELEALLWPPQKAEGSKNG